MTDAALQSRQAQGLALFDLDNTLLTGDSDYEWGQFLIDCGVLDRDSYESRNREFFDQYKAGTLDIHAYLEFALEPLAAHSMEDLERWHAAFMVERVAPMMGEAAHALVRRHLDAGDLCAVITATNSFVTAPIARAFGIAHLIATEPERSNGRFTGRLSGTPCFREGKIEKLAQWLQSQGRVMQDFETSTFYSDSLNDLPLLGVVTHPVAVDPDETLAAESARRGWPVIRLR